MYKFHFLDFNLYIRDSREKKERAYIKWKVLWLSSTCFFHLHADYNSTPVLSCDIKRKMIQE